MRTRLSWLMLIMGLMVFRSGAAIGQAQSNATGPHIEVTLMSEYASLVPGTTTYIGVLLSPDPEWHTYWRNPGDSGEAPVIALSSGSDLTFGQIQWPLPKAIPVAHLVNYGYESQNLLMIPVTVPAQLNDNPVKVTADLSWLVCKEDCIPGFATLTIELPVTGIYSDSESTQLFTSTRAMLPLEQWGQGKFEVNDDTLVVELSDLVNLASNADIDVNDWTLFPFRSDVAQHAAKQQSILDNEILRSVIAKSVYFDGQAETLQWLLSNGEAGIYVTTTNNIMPGDPVSGDTNLSLVSLITFMIMAFVGGLILNLMPCVLPVLSIKALGIQNIQTNLSTKLAYLLGVVVCFNLFAIVIIILQTGGQQVGWGFQMQEPAVIVLLSFLFTFIALVLLDVFHVGSRFAGVGESLVSGKGWSSNFFTGVLAVIVASPCTAPFMAAALGVALVSEPHVTLLLFNALALGFALPLTLLFVSKRFNRLMPKPGAWMNTFKHLLAFPMLATVAWLCWVYAGQTNLQAQFGLLIALIVFCMSLWLMGQLKNSVIKTILTLTAIICISLPVYLAKTLPPSDSNNGQIAQEYTPFSPSTLAALKRDNKVVVVNMTADWCITCKVNEHVAFSDTEVKKILNTDGVSYMVGDWTNKNDTILAYLQQYDRAGVPLYVIYAGEKSIQVLPQILTPNRVINAINQAIKETSDD